jgi:hypothetical protein
MNNQNSNVEKEAESLIMKVEKVVNQYQKLKQVQDDLQKKVSNLEVNENFKNSVKMLLISIIIIDYFKKIVSSPNLRSHESQPSKTGTNDLSNGQEANATQNQHATNKVGFQ